MKRIAVGLVLLGVALSSSLAPAAEESKEIRVGAKAPNFTLKGSDGKTYKLSDFKGKKGVIVAWYPLAFTGG